VRRVGTRDLDEPSRVTHDLRGAFDEKRDDCVRGVQGFVSGRWRRWRRARACCTTRCCDEEVGRWRRRVGVGLAAYRQVLVQLGDCVACVPSIIDAFHGVAVDADAKRWLQRPRASCLRRGILVYTHTHARPTAELTHPHMDA
jgi:hypothetical protein